MREPSHPSVIEIDPEALRQNVRFLRSRIAPETVFCSVVKGNAYGHGIEAYVPVAESAGVRHFAVYSAREALQVVRSRTFSESQVMIMGWVADDELAWAVENDVAFWVFDPPRLHSAIAEAARQGRKARVHLEVETGLNRTGLGREVFCSLAETIRNAGDRLELDGICTHYAGAESVANHLRIREQKERFDAHTAELASLGLRFRCRHTACSAAALSYPDTVMDLVRFGIAQYGFWPSRETRMHYMTRTGQRGRDPLKRVLRWTSRIMSIKDVPAGQFVGYGTSYLPEKRIRVAVVPVGYSDGYSRRLSNLGRVLVRGRRASVVGLVNMSALLVNVTRVPGVQRGDEVVLIGKQGRLSISVASFSDMTRTVDYETLTRLPSDIPRVVCESA